MTQEDYFQAIINGTVPPSTTYEQWMASKQQPSPTQTIAMLDQAATANTQGGGTASGGLMAGVPGSTASLFVFPPGEGVGSFNPYANEAWRAWNSATTSTTPTTPTTPGGNTNNNYYNPTAPGASSAGADWAQRAQNAVPKLPIVGLNDWWQSAGGKPFGAL